MQTNVPPEYLIQLADTIADAASAQQMHSVAFYMMAQELVGNGSAISDLTLGEISAARACASERYKKMMKRLEVNRG